jgi:drug/metabolite transporter (DMT)-like permease
MAAIWPNTLKFRCLSCASGNQRAQFSGSTLPALQADETPRLFGTLIILLAPVSYACGLNWVRRLRNIDTAVMVTWAFTFATLLLLSLVAALEGVPASIQPGTSVATKFSTVTFIAPVSALLIGWLVLDEVLGPSHFLGMAAIFLGQFLIDGLTIRARILN